MDSPIVESLASSWPGVLFIAGMVGGVIAWLATKNTRKAMQAGQDQLVSVYTEQIKAQEGLARTLAESNHKQIEILTKERADSDARHEAVITDYRTRNNALRDTLQECTVKQGEVAAKLAEMTARTDFKPVLDFQKVWYEETKEINKMTLKTMQEIMPVLHEVSEALRYFGKNVQDVRVTNTPIKVTETEPV